MSAPLRSRIGAQLYGLLPEVYRARDKSEDLARYLDACGELLDRVYATLRRRLDDHFPETCQEWLIPYFADLLDVAMKSPAPEGRRAEVARAIAWRQRKGTSASTEEIAEAVGGMEVELQEAWRRVARTAGAGIGAATVDLRRHSRAQRVGQRSLTTRTTRFPGREDPVHWEQANPSGVPCFPGSYEDRSMRTADVRTPDWQRGHYHPRRLLAFVPVPEGFFAAGAPELQWTALARLDDPALLAELQALEPLPDGRIVRRRLVGDVLEEVDELTPQPGGGAVWKTTFRRVPANAPPLRIEGAVSLEGPAIAGVKRSHRFEGVHLRNTLTVKVGTLELERCAAFKVVVHSHEERSPALSAADCLLRHVQAASGLAQLEYCTVLGKTICDVIQAVDCVFLGNLQRDLHDPATPPAINCLRHVRVPRALLDAVGESDRKFIQRFTTEVPVFFRLGFGAAGAGVLHPATPASIRAGAEDGGELGAYHHQYLSLRWEAVRDKLGEFLPLGLEPVLIPDPRLGCVPPK